MRPLFSAVGDGNHSGNRRGGLRQGASGQWDPVRTTPFALVDLQKIRISAAVEPTPLSGFRSRGAQWSPRGRSDVIGRCRPLCELLLTWSYGYKCFSVSRATARCTLGTFMSSRACPQPIAHVARGHFQIHNSTHFLQRVRVTLPSCVEGRRFFVLKIVVPNVSLAPTKLPHPADLHRTGRDRAPRHYQR